MVRQLRTGGLLQLLRSSSSSVAMPPCGCSLDRCTAHLMRNRDITMSQRRHEAGRGGAEGGGGAGGAASRWH